MRSFALALLALISITGTLSAEGVEGIPFFFSGNPEGVRGLDADGQVSVRLDPQTMLWLSPRKGPIPRVLLEAGAAEVVILFNTLKNGLAVRTSTTHFAYREGDLRVRLESSGRVDMVWGHAEVVDLATGTVSTLGPGDSYPR